MHHRFRSPRIAPLAFGVIAACLTGIAGAAQTTTTDQDAAFRQAVSTAGTRTPVGLPGGIVAAATGSKSNDNNTLTPIKHVILIIGENRTFDHLFATYTPKQGQTIDNLLSKGIVKVNKKGKSSPGPNAQLAIQYQASDTGKYDISPKRITPYGFLPDTTTGSAPTNAHFTSVAAAQAVEPALEQDDYSKLTVGGTGLPTNTSPDPRLPAQIPNGPFDLHASFSYDDYTADIVHRFFQMWQQMDCDPKAITNDNPSGCRMDLFPWVGVTVGTGTNGNAQPANFTDVTTGQGPNSMGYSNMAAGDVPYFKELADDYTISDNFHQSVMGGTGANHIMLGFGTAIFYAGKKGEAEIPPANQIENPDAQPGTNNWWVQDGYSGGSYVNCADETQPGVRSVRNYLKKLPYKTFKGTDCKSGAYYLVNNYNPGYLGDGTPAPLGSNQFTIPPSDQPNLATMLEDHKVSWKYYGEGWDGGKEDGDGGYCNICNPFLFSSKVMTNAKLRANNQDVNDLYNDIQDNTLPAVSIVKPDGLLDGHPGSSKTELFEGFTKKIVDMVKANPQVWADTAVVITYDEGGGYYDSGYVQPIDFFGDGTRIPLIVVSKYSTGGKVVHTYYDHVSFDKFVEANWQLNDTISARSRDTLPNPVQDASYGRGYAPINAPALGNLFDMFDFGHKGNPAYRD